MLNVFTKDQLLAVLIFYLNLKFWFKNNFLTDDLLLSILLVQCRQGPARSPVLQGRRGKPGQAPIFQQNQPRILYPHGGAQSNTQPPHNPGEGQFAWGREGAGTQPCTNWVHQPHFYLLILWTILQPPKLLQLIYL